MSKFVKTNNTAVAVASILRDLLESEEMMLSAWFHPRFVKKTLHTRGDLNQILQKAFDTSTVEYSGDIVALSTLIQNFIDLVYATAQNGNQVQVLDELEAIFKKNGLVLVPV